MATDISAFWKMYVTSAEEIKTGKAEGLPFEFQGAKGKIAHVPGPDKGNIVYNEERIWKKDTVIS
ncbi:MAG: hypothetical protein ACLT1J_02795 [Mediterraneibacter gnavus]